MGCRGIEIKRIAVDVARLAIFRDAEDPAFAEALDLGSNRLGGFAYEANHHALTVEVA
jgi:hypothetical protein